jgi:DMSO/TMAO reductase YedYZ molybdopterin-dependent catalytic subunit
MILYNRRRLVVALGASAGGLLLAGCDRINSSPLVRNVLGVGETVNRRAQRFIDRHALAPEFSAKDLSPDFRTNGNTMPGSDSYARHMSEGFAHWRLAVNGLVTRPLQLSLAQIKAAPQRTQITRHDCVEGWSAIGQWTGLPLNTVLRYAGLMPEARFIVFHCADDFDGTPYYESIDLVDAFHPQTILAWSMNGRPLSVGHGAPLRLRVERQLGYKHAKYVMRIEAVSSLHRIGEGGGGYWEDAAAYQWYAGI